jgi:release factor glutamine methyltransferase
MVPAYAKHSSFEKTSFTSTGRLSQVPWYVRRVAPDRVMSEVAGRLRAAGSVFAEDEARLLIDAARTASELEGMVAHRVSGLPIEHIVGWAEFCGLRIEVGPGVFVPRRRTELLVAEALAIARPGSLVIDMCCGAAPVGAALAASVPEVEVHAVDIEPAAVACARRNLAGPGRHVYAGDLFEPLPSGLCGRVDIIVANAPYVPTDSLALMPREARLHEPTVALDGGADGLDLQRRIAASASTWLAPGGSLLIETSEHQSADTLGLIADAGLVPRLAHSDEFDATVVTGTRRE